MIKTFTAAALVATTLAGTAFATESHRRAPAATDYYATYDRRAAAPAPAEAPAPREDFGSYGAGNTARNLGY